MKIIKSVSLIFVLSFIFCGVIQAQNIGSLRNVVTPGFSFSMDLRSGYTDQDVMELQRVLNADVDTTVAIDGEGSSGHESKYFGNQTKLAVIKFQEKYRDTILTPSGLTSGSGFVGKATRTKLNLLIGVMNTVESTGSPESTGVTVVNNTVTDLSVTNTTVTNTQTSLTQTAVCNFVELLINIQAISQSNATRARNVLGCGTGERPSLELEVNNRSGTLTIASARYVTLSWESENVTTCRSSSGSQPLSGSDRFYVSRSGTFTISCTGPYGSVSDSVKVRLSTDDTDDTDDTTDTDDETATSTATSTATTTLKVSCSANPTVAMVGLPVFWTATPSGVMGPYTYRWSGTEDLNEIGQFVFKTYSEAGPKTALITVSSGSYVATSTCRISVTDSTTLASSTASTTPEEEGAGPDRFFSFWGVVTAVGDCDSHSDMKLWKVEIDSCGSSQPVSMQDLTGIASHEPGYIVIREGHQDVPSVGDGVRGTAVDDMGLKCGGGGRYIGTVTGALGGSSSGGSSCDTTSAGLIGRIRELINSGKIGLKDLKDVSSLRSAATKNGLDISGLGDANLFGLILSPTMFGTNLGGLTFVTNLTDPNFWITTGLTGNVFLGVSSVADDVGDSFADTFGW
jgi:hypothetical protein